MSRSIGILAVHGIGRYFKKGKDDPTGQLTFSRSMHDRLFARQKWLGGISQHIAWREATYAFALDERASGLSERLGELVTWKRSRDFFLTHFGDAAAYRPDFGKRTAYDEYHAYIDRAVDDLAKDIGPDGVMIVLAHSLGGHVMSNYIWDRSKAFRQTGGPDPLRGMQKVAALITFGCNIPVFTLAWNASDVAPIQQPGEALPEAVKRLRPWWINLYDKEDVLGFPLKPIGPQYEALGDQLEDVQVNAGNWFQAWNPMSHVGYWENTATLARVAAKVNAVYAALQRR